MFLKQLATELEVEVFVVPPSYKEWLSRFGNRDRNRLNIAINEFLIAESICDYFIINDTQEKEYIVEIITDIENLISKLEEI